MYQAVNNTTDNFINSDGWKLVIPNGIQRRAPLTPLPTPGISTNISSTKANANMAGAKRSHTLSGTLKAKIPMQNAIAIESA